MRLVFKFLIVCFGVSAVSFTFYVIWMLQQLFVASRHLGGFVP